MNTSQNAKYLNLGQHWGRFSQGIIIEFSVKAVNWFDVSVNFRSSLFTQFIANSTFGQLSVNFRSSFSQFQLMAQLFNFFGTFNSGSTHCFPLFFSFPLSPPLFSCTGNKFGCLIRSRSKDIVFGQIVKLKIQKSVKFRFDRRPTLLASFWWCARPQM